ncbi:CAF17-like 4Fe-4S cluster assembly/insertion protein YgfZ [Thiosocius teredinicola]|uniref:CAF17-like 4Fe-4S cluster assembly/insertion protein YgfZ n=1 Tax=Thiosocius teredinicola TaxID=1973002 RepID=UPI000991299E
MNTWQETVTPKAPLGLTFPDCAVTDLSHFGLIKVNGDDTRTFLQGQLTNDIREVSPELVQLSSYCSPKGRMLGSFLIFQRGDDLYMQLPMERLDATLKRLTMFVLRSQVKLENASEQLARVGLAGDCAAGLLPFAPSGDKASETRDDLTIIRLPGDRPRFELIAPVATMTGLWADISAKAEQSGPEFWALMDIRAGMPTVFEDTVEAFVPQMTNMQLIGGVSFTKGCYTGQEIVARMQYLGKLKRRMYRLHADVGERPAPGTELHSPTSASGQGAGRIVDAAPSPDGGYEVLAVLEISVADGGDIHLDSVDGPALKLLDLPYELPPIEE